MGDVHPVPPPSARTTLKRRPDRAAYERGAVARILDEGLVCHVGFALPDGPVVLPMAYARIDDTLYVHGAQANRMLRTLSEGVPVCVTVTLLDGLVISRSAFHSSMNYRSAVVYGTAHRVEDPAEKQRALMALVDHVVPGRSKDLRPPSEAEVEQTRVLALALDEASAKQRSGGPVDRRFPRK